MWGFPKGEDAGGGPGSDTTAIHVDQAGEINGIALKATPVGADVLVIEDSADSFNKKRIPLSDVLGGSTIPGGAAGAVQFNDGAGGFGGSANLQFIGTTLLKMPFDQASAQIALGLNGGFQFFHDGTEAAIHSDDDLVFLMNGVNGGDYIFTLDGGGGSTFLIEDSGSVLRNRFAGDSATVSSFMRLGADTSAINWQVQNNSGTNVWAVNGAGEAAVNGAPVAGVELTVRHPSGNGDIFIDMADAIGTRLRIGQSVSPIPAGTLAAHIVTDSNGNLQYISRGSISISAGHIFSTRNGNGTAHPTRWRINTNGQAVLGENQAPDNSTQFRVRESRAVYTVTTVAAGSTFTTSAPHGLTPGDTVVHTAFADGAYNGTFVVDSTATTTTYVITAVPFTATGTGTSTSQPLALVVFQDFAGNQKFNVSTIGLVTLRDASDNPSIWGNVIGVGGFTGFSLNQDLPAVADYTMISDGSDLFINTPGAGDFAIREGNATDRLFISATAPTQVVSFRNSTTADVAAVLQIQAKGEVTTTGEVEQTRVESGWTDIGELTNDSSWSVYTRVANVLAKRLEILSGVVFGTFGVRVASTAINATTTAMGTADIYRATAASIAITISKADITAGRQFTFKGRNTAINVGTPVTVTVETNAITSVTDQGGAGSEFIMAVGDHGYVVGTRIVHTGFPTAAYNGSFVVTAIPASFRYQVQAITFVASEAGTSQTTIDGIASVDITADDGGFTVFVVDGELERK